MVRATARKMRGTLRSNSVGSRPLVFAVSVPVVDTDAALLIVQTQTSESP